MRSRTRHAPVQYRQRTSLVLFFAATLQSFLQIHASPSNQVSLLYIAQLCQGLQIVCRRAAHRTARYMSNPDQTAHISDW